MNPESLFEIETKTIDIDLPVSVSPNLSLPLLWSYNGSEFLACYNHLDHSIVILDITQRRFVKVIELEREGPDFVASVRSISIINDNVFLVGGNEYLTLLDFGGHVKDRFLINSLSSDFTGFDFSKGRVFVNKYSGLQFEKADSSIILEAYPFNKEGDDYGSRSFLVKLKLSDMRIEKLEITNSHELIDEAGNYGELEGFHFMRKNDSLILNHKSSSRILFKYGNHEKVEEMRSSATPNNASPIREFSRGYNTSRMEHQIKSPHFYPIAHDQRKGLYYRIFKSEVDKVEDEPKFFISLLSEDLRNYAEFRFPKGYYIFSIPSKEGPMFMAFNKFDDKLELLNFKFR